MATYKVQSGDTLSGIAKKYGIKGYNTIKTRSGNPNLIYAGEELNLPDAPAPVAPAVPPQAPAPLGSTERTNQLLQQSSQQTGLKAPTFPTPSPVVPLKPLEAQPATSLTQAGQQYLSARQTAGHPSDAVTIQKLYRDRGMEDKYGSWRGSDVQYRAMWAEDIQEGINQINQRIATEGI